MRKVRIKPEALTQVCKSLDLSRDELARQMGVTGATAYRVDAGKVEPSARFIASLMHVSGFTFDQLFEIVEAAA